jgi:hypothetical protein
MGPMILSMIGSQLSKEKKRILYGKRARPEVIMLSSTARQALVWHPSSFPSRLRGPGVSREIP